MAFGLGVLVWFEGFGPLSSGVVVVLRVGLSLAVKRTRV